MQPAPLPSHAHAFLDANVLYPATLRSFFIDLALLEVMRVSWSGEVQDERTRNLLRQRPSLDLERVRRTVLLMDRALPDARVSGYEALTPTLSLPDPDDRHVLAAAIHAGAGIIVTQNLRDFPAAVLEPYGVRALGPDEYLSGFLPAALGPMRTALEAQRLRYQPPVSREELLGRLGRQGVPMVAAALARGW